MRPQPIPPALTARPFTVAEARASGVSWRVLQGRRFCSPAHGVYAPAGMDATLVGRVFAALTVLPPASAATGVTALQLLGVDVGSAEPLRFGTTSPRQVRRQGLRVTRVSVLPPIRGLGVLPEHGWMVAALELNLLELVTAGDWLLRLKLTTTNALAAHLAASSSRGSAAARPALVLVRPRVDSHARVGDERSGRPVVDILRSVDGPGGSPSSRGRMVATRGVYDGSRAARGAQTSTEARTSAVWAT